MHSSSRLIGVFGGTFDSIHFGHLRIAQELIDAADLTRLHLIPTGTPPHREEPRATARQRLDMVRLAALGHPVLFADSREAEREGYCYTVDTLAELRKEYGSATPIMLLVGADAFACLNTWHDWRALFELAHIVVAHRPGFPLGDWRGGLAPALSEELAARLEADLRTLQHRAAGGISWLAVTQLDISATAIRTQIGTGTSPRYLLPDEVIDYIGKNGLYR